MSVEVEKHGPVTVVTLSRPEVRNAVDAEHARLLTEAFTAFDADESASVAILYGAGGVFCAGADLKAVSEGRVDVGAPGDGPDAGPAGMGPTRMLLSKPVIAAVEGYAVAGGLELAVWCDLRVMDPDAAFGVFCRRWGVPLIDGGTIRLPRLIGHSHALDLILTGREVGADEALRMGLANRVSAPRQACWTRRWPWPPSSRRSRRPACGRTAWRRTGSTGWTSTRPWRSSGNTASCRCPPDTLDGASRFAGGAGRHGAFE